MTGALTLFCPYRPFTEYSLPFRLPYVFTYLQFAFLEQFLLKMLYGIRDDFSVSPTRDRETKQDYVHKTVSLISYASLPPIIFNILCTRSSFSTLIYSVAYRSDFPFLGASLYYTSGGDMS